MKENVGCIKGKKEKTGSVEEMAEKKEKTGSVEEMAEKKEKTGSAGGMKGKKEKNAKKIVSVPLIEPKERLGGEVKYSQVEFSNLQGADALKKLVKIEKESLIELIILKYPQLAADLMEAGMHCVGCPVAGFETLYDGCAAHGMDDKQIDALIKKLNKKIMKEKK